MKKKIFYTVFSLLLFVALGNFTYAASATISASKSSVNVGDSVTITVNINAAAWNVKTSGSITSEVIAGFNMDGVNQSTTKTYKLDTSKAGTYTASISGDITDANDTNTNVGSTVTVTVKEKTIDTNTNTNTNTNTGTGSSTTSKPSTNTNTQKPVTKSSDATLKSLKVDVEGLNPLFNKNTYLYTLTVSSEVESLKVTASTNHSKAKYKVTGNTNLKNGDNTVLVTVTAENGSTKTYKIIVTKAEDPEKANAYLTNIVVDNGTLNEEFARETMEYTVKDVTFDVTKLQISAFPENAKAGVIIEGNDELKVGQNIIKIVVTAEDGKTTKEYTIKVIRNEEPKTDINSSEVIEQNSMAKEENDTFWKQVASNKELQLIITIYVLAIVEFVEIIYLFIQLRKYKTEIKSTESNYNKRRRD